MLGCQACITATARGVVTFSVSAQKFDQWMSTHHLWHSPSGRDAVLEPAGDQRLACPGREHVHRP